MDESGGQTQEQAGAITLLFEEQSGRVASVICLLGSTMRAHGRVQVIVREAKIVPLM